ncbi:hypothetical protein G7046_g4718 [Stylonectria norvegica]|nr:hypothetical protein G7046_g4718 [Stylonectria norvegica]
MNNQPTTVADAPQAGQDASEEAHLEESMQRLKLLHNKARELRDAIPRMIDPLISKHPSPDAMFAAFMRSVSDAQAEVKEFTDLMRDDTSQQVLALAEKSRENDPMGIKPWRHKDHPSWFRLDKD